MRAYGIFLRDHFREVSFGWLLTFYSSFGQTFYISLFVPFLLTELEISKGLFGGIYAAATVIASFILLGIGSRVDYQPVKPFTQKVVLVLILSTVLLAVTIHWAMLFISLLGLRLAGQGLMSHISMSVMSRRFTLDRGKALSLSSLGYSMGEMLFPPLIAVLLTLWHWRAGALFSAALILTIVPLIQQSALENLNPNTEKTQSGQRFYWQMMKEARFWVIAWPLFSQGFLVTGIFFYQYLLAEEKGWPLEIYALLFAGYGGVRLIFSLFGGSLTDRWSATRLFPFYLVPFLLALALLSMGGSLWLAGTYLLLIGISVGLSGPIKAAAIAELFGVAQIGRVSSLFTVVMVISSALAPMLLGIFLDMGISFESMALVLSGLLLLVIIHNFRIFRLNRGTKVSMEDQEPRSSN